MSESEGDRLSDHDVAALKMLTFQAGAQTSTDVLAASTRSERDRLFIVGIGCLLLISGKSPEKAIGLEGWQAGDPRFLPTAMLFALAYYLISFAVLSITDFSRWSLSLPGAVAPFQELTRRLALHMNSVKGEQYIINDEMRERMNNLSKLKAPLEDRIRESEKIQANSEAFSPEYVSALTDIRDAYVELQRISEDFDSSDLLQRSDMLRDSNKGAAGALEVLENR